MFRYTFEIFARQSIAVLTLLCLTGSVASSLWVYPHSLAYFNEFAGGPNNGRAHLLHSSLDWGQGLIELDRVLDHHIEWGPIAIAYSGPINPEHLVSRTRSIDWYSHPSSLDGYSHVAISANILEGDTKAYHWYPRPPSAAKFESFFRERQPIATLGGSIYIFDAQAFTDFCERFHSATFIGLDSIQHIASKPKGRSQDFYFNADAAGSDNLSVWGCLRILLLHGFGETRLRSAASGQEVFRMLTDEQLLRAFFAKSRLVRTRSDTRYRVSGSQADGDYSSIEESHRDQCLCTFAGLRFSLAELVVLWAKQLSFRPLVTEPIADLAFGQSGRVLAAPVHWIILVATVAHHANSSDLRIVINAGPTLENSPAALAALKRAAAKWENAFADPITVTIDADLAPLRWGQLAQTKSRMLSADYNLVRNALVDDAAKESDDLIVQSLPVGANFTADTPNGFVLDGNIALTKANLKALNFDKRFGDIDRTYGAVDATIVFNSAIPFSFASSTSVFGRFDFEAVATHELGHALGFVSVVRYIDEKLEASTKPHLVSPCTLDLFRFDNGGPFDPSTLEDFSLMRRSFIPGNDEMFDQIRHVRGNMVEIPFSTGVHNGDGHDPSHWKNDLGLGIQSPAIHLSGTSEIKSSDLRALDLIGYSVDFSIVSAD